MSGLEPKYHEHLLHWIWKNLHLELSNLQTTCGQTVTVFEEGTLNRTDGPDFKNARLKIGVLEWAGDIEFHWSTEDWRQHGHHEDPRYNQVILHVVYHSPADTRPINRPDGTSPYTLHIRPFLSESLDKLLNAYQLTDSLPCAGHVHYLNEEVFQKQFERAHREYFESKSDSLLERYDPSLPPSRAWKKALVLSLFDGLGISQNREQMLHLGKELYQKLHADQPARELPSVDHLKHEAYHVAGFGRSELQQHGEIRWNRKGCRPANRPRIRVEQAAILLHQVEQLPLPTFYQQSPQQTWNTLLSAIDTPTGIGRQRSDILYGIVFLPALWMLGNLFHIPRLKKNSYKHWKEHEAQLPGSLFSQFEQAGIPPEYFRKKLGAVYQLKHYCKPRRCEQCEVLKKIISS